MMVLKGNLLVGWNVGPDFLSLGVSATNVLDLAKDYFVDENNQEYSLKDTYEHFFGKKIQCEAHCAIVDARATRDVYYKYLEVVKEYLRWIDYPRSILSVLRKKNGSMIQKILALAQRRRKRRRLRKMRHENSFLFQHN